MTKKYTKSGGQYADMLAGQKMWTVGGGKDGYDQLRDARIADDPILSIYLRNDEVESHNCAAGVRDHDETRIKCDKSESEVLRSKGARATFMQDT